MANELKPCPFCGTKAILQGKRTFYNEVKPAPTYAGQTENYEEISPDDELPF